MCTFAVVNACQLDSTSTEEVQSYIKTLKNSKSTSPSSIPNKLFKQFKKPLSELLTLSINLTFSKDQFPLILKVGKIFPVQGLAHRMQVPLKIQVFRKRNTAILGDIQKTCGIPTNLFIIEKKKVTNNSHSYFYTDMKKPH